MEKQNSKHLLTVGSFFRIAEIPQKRRFVVATTCASEDLLVLTLQKLRNFVAVAEEGQFLRASERLGTSQPTLSAQIKELEFALGVTLFSRTTRQLALTTEGERFYHRIKGVLSALEHAVAEVREQAELKKGHIDIAATPSVAATILPQAMALFRRQFPEITVRVAEESLHGLEEKVRNGQVNFGIGPTAQAASADFNFTVLFKERFFAVLPLEHALAGAHSLRLEQIASDEIITTGPQTGIGDVVAAALRENGYRVSRAHALNRHDTVIAMVEASLGVAILPELGLQRTDAAKVRIVPLIQPEITREVGIIERKGGSVSAAAAGFLSFLRSEELLASFRLTGEGDR